MGGWDSTEEGAAEGVVWEVEIGSMWDVVEVCRYIMNEMMFLKIGNYIFLLSNFIVLYKKNFVLNFDRGWLINWVFKDDKSVIDIAKKETKIGCLIEVFISFGDASMMFR